MQHSNDSNNNDTIVFIFLPFWIMTLRYFMCFPLHFLFVFGVFFFFFFSECVLC